MSNNILIAPGVSVAAFSQFDRAAFEDTIDHLDLNGVAVNPDTPLGKIADRAIEGSGEFSDLEMLPEFGGRFCYGSWKTGRGTEAYNQNILEMGHGSVLEHASISFVITGVSRALTHELVRHRVGVAISQESQRYVDMSEANFVMPPLLVHALGGDIKCQDALDWRLDQKSALDSYLMWQDYLEQSLRDQLKAGNIELDADISNRDIPWDDKVEKMLTRVKKRANEAARASLPNAVETRLLWTVNLRMLRNFIILRGSEPADLEIRRLACEIADKCKELAPSIFADINIKAGSFGVNVIEAQYRNV